MMNNELDWDFDPYDEEQMKQAIKDGHYLETKIEISLLVPAEVEKSALDCYISHWLTEGYFVHDYLVQLPEGIEYIDYQIKYPKIQEVQNETT